MLTFGDVQNDLGIQRITNYCPTSPDFAGLVNDAIRRGMRRGDFVGTLVPIYVCVRAGCVVWPRYVQSVRKVGFCHSAIQPANMWGDFLPYSAQSPWRAGCNWMMPQAAMVNQGKTSVFQDVQGEGRLIRAYCRCNADIGKTITIFGTDNNGQPLLTQDPATHTWTPGIVLVLTNTFVSTPTFVRSIDYILKDETNCPVDVYAYNATTDLLEDIAHYDPGETRPSFERSRLTMPFPGGINCATSTSCCGVNRGIAALVKLRFIPVKYATDLIPLDNIDAIKLLIQAIKFGEAGDRNNAKLHEADAITELNRQLDDEFPDETFVADNHVLADRTFTNNCF